MTHSMQTHTHHTHKHVHNHTHTNTHVFITHTENSHMWNILFLSPGCISVSRASVVLMLCEMLSRRRAPWASFCGQGGKGSSSPWIHGGPFGSTVPTCPPLVFPLQDCIQLNQYKLQSEIGKVSAPHVDLTLCTVLPAPFVWSGNDIAHGLKLLEEILCVLLCTLWSVEAVGGQVKLSWHHNHFPMHLWIPWVFPNVGTDFRKQNCKSAHLHSVIWQRLLSKVTRCWGWKQPRNAINIGATQHRSVKLLFLHSSCEFLKSSYRFSFLVVVVKCFVGVPQNKLWNDAPALPSFYDFWKSSIL